MDSQGYNNDDKWVEERIANLSPPPGWRPDTDKALESLMQRTSPQPISRGLRLSMASATIAVIAVIVALLPWKALWMPEKEPVQGSTQVDAKLVQSSPQVPVTGTVPLQDDAPQTQKPDAPATQTTPPAQVNPPPTPQDSKQETIRRPKKLPRIIAGTIEEPRQEPVPSIAQAQTPQSPPSGVTQPVVISQVQPKYTDEAREARIQGTVELSATVREDGTVKVERVVRGLGYGLDESATGAVEQWKFIPGKKDGQPVAVTTNLLIHFSLK